MSSGLLAALATAAAVVVVLCVALLALVVRSRSDRRRLEEALAASREELVAVQRRLEALARQVERPSTAGPDYVITTAGEPAGLDAPAPAPYEPMTAGRFASVALGESLVRIVSFGYGVRRALSAENRNRIGFEMRREVRRSRKQRKEDLKAARRHLRSTAGQEAA